MADCFDTATRSRIMRAIKGKGTKPERAFLLALRRRKPAYVFATAAKNRLPGRPDVLVHNAFTGARLAVFVHGCFWHRCPRHFKAPQSGKNGAAGWRKKFEQNVRRDRRVRRRLRALRWRTLVVWEHEDMARAAARVIRRIHAGR
jgi:DNA mismatch endonuclease (patch repair protein)